MLSIREGDAKIRVYYQSIVPKFYFSLHFCHLMRSIPIDKIDQPKLRYSFEYSGTPLSEHLGVAPKVFGNHEVFGKQSFDSMLNDA